MGQAIVNNSTIGLGVVIKLGFSRLYYAESPFYHMLCLFTVFKDWFGFVVKGDELLKRRELCVGKLGGYFDPVPSVIKGNKLVLSAFVAGE